MYIYIYIYVYVYVHRHIYIYISGSPRPNRCSFRFVPKEEEDEAENASKEKNLTAAGIICLVLCFSYPIPTSHKLSTERNVPAPKRGWLEDHTRHRRRRTWPLPASFVWFYVSHVLYPHLTSWAQSVHRRRGWPEDHKRHRRRRTWPPPASWASSPCSIPLAAGHHIHPITSQEFVWGFGVLFLSCVCVSRVLFSVGVCVCVWPVDLFIQHSSISVTAATDEPIPITVEFKYARLSFY